jgi:hypothetical protein
MSNRTIFNPLEKLNLGKSVVDALLEREASPLKNVDDFHGAGVYAIYYRGDFPHYAALSRANKKEAAYPIYVGKAVPQGGRKGLSDDASQESNALSRRLKEHKMSIEFVSQTLDIADFSYRSLAVDDIWIPLGETLVIQKFQPLWNQIVEGFGNHDPGGGRHEGKRPAWDELHTGRPWAARCKSSRQTKEQIIEEIKNYMKRFTVQ